MYTAFYPNLFLLFEILAFISFAVVLGREIGRTNFTRVFEVISCAAFGLILEVGNTYLAHTYSYSANFVLQMNGVPVAIGLGWAVIIYSAMLLSDQYAMPWTLKPFLDALTAVLLDLSLDIVAIRLGFWKWAIPYNEEWYGVPFENLVGWILVVLAFSFLIRWIRTKDLKLFKTKLLLIFSPFISYALLLVGLSVYGFIALAPYQINNWNSLLKFNYKPDQTVLYNPEVQLWKLIFFTILLVEIMNIVGYAIYKYRFTATKLDYVGFVILSGIHLFFIFALFESGIYKQNAFFIFFSLTIFCLHILLHFLPYIKLRHPVLAKAFVKKTDVKVFVKD